MKKLFNFTKGSKEKMVVAPPSQDKDSSSGQQQVIKSPKIEAGTMGFNLDGSVGLQNGHVGLAHRLIPNDPTKTIRLLDLQDTNIFVRGSVGVGSSHAYADPTMKDIGAAAGGQVTLSAKGGNFQSVLVQGGGVGLETGIGFDLAAFQKGDQDKLLCAAAKFQGLGRLNWGSAQILGGAVIRDPKATELGEIAIRTPGAGLQATARGGISEANLHSIEAALALNAGAEVTLAEIQGLSIGHFGGEAGINLSLGIGAGRIVGDLASATISVPGGTIVSADGKSTTPGTYISVGV